MGVAALAQVAIPFIWLGAVLGISFLEAPLKFRAPGITVALGLGIGRLVFRALNVAELVLAAALTAAVLTGARDIGADLATLVLIMLWVLLAVQVAALRPRLNARTRLILAGATPPRSHLHLAYITLEAVKVVLLPLLGVLLALRVAA
ncbi:hypothetical protein ACVGVM_28025 (plasmid) [Pseudonocardia bannensis]|uniref:Transmembrane protein n=1 Tax=Pseudonocardia bannensis TaxID=630973 RepID=A0A848DIL0_9PSEU|nr:hypothetical protein [Pseudonocardia bannensis]